MAAAKISAATDTSMSAVRRQCKLLTPSRNWPAWSVGDAENTVIIVATAGARVVEGVSPVKRWGTFDGFALPELW